MIRYLQGNLFESKADALVNTVNCVGIMGKGIAYQFKRAYPEMFKDYQRRCKANEIRLGELTTFQTKDHLIINFPTKDHWKSASRIEDIRAGLEALRQLIDSLNIRSVALPPLGCGNGGLPWPEVRQAIDNVLANLTGVYIEAYEPVGDFSATTEKEPRLTLSHYVVIHLRRLLPNFNKITLQKAAYFFNVYAGVDYFRFEEYKFGPYCLAIDPMIRTIIDYIAHTKIAPELLLEDGLTRKLAGIDADRLRAWLPVINRAALLCRAEVGQIEALATVHAILAKQSPLTNERLCEAFYAWSEEKQRFTEADILRAAHTLTRYELARLTLLGFEVAKAPAEAPRTAG